MEPLHSVFHAPNILGWSNLSLLICTAKHTCGLSANKEEITKEGCFSMCRRNSLESTDLKKLIAPELYHCEDNQLNQQVHNKLREKGGKEEGTPHLKHPGSRRFLARCPSHMFILSRTERGNISTSIWGENYDEIFGISTWSWVFSPEYQLMTMSRY